MRGRRAVPWRGARAGWALAVLLAAAMVAGVPRPALAGPSGLPDGVPPAALRPEPRLPGPAGWPFGEHFPRTSGTGRLAAGAVFWSDFLYDDHGARGIPVGRPVATLAPPDGTYVYPPGPARGNGADVFRAAVGLDDRYTYWRVDWTTLVDPRVPVALWALDTDGSTATGTDRWPAGAGLRSPGIDAALLVSGRGAWLIDPVDGRRLPVGALGGSLTVDRAARSFVVRLPRQALPPVGTWRVRLAAGLADDAGEGFRPVGPELGALPGQPPVYNLTFRSYRQEPPRRGGLPAPDVPGLRRPGIADPGNHWLEDAQAEALARGDATPFYLDVRWADLAARRTTPEPLPRGYSNRWYVSSVEPGQGVVPNEGGASTDLRPNFLSRVQPYAVYVPSRYDGRRPAPLTWILHSLGVNHNQYGVRAPDFLRQACEERGSICVTPLGRGPDGWYLDEAELDFFEVWRDVASAYRLDPERTVIAGYSMGGYGAYRLGLTYPHLFARAVSLAGPPVCGIRVVPPVERPAAASDRCGSADTLPLVGNARWLPYFVAHGALDQLVPVSSVWTQAEAFDRLGYRYRFELYPAEDHLLYATKDGFSSAAAFMGDARRVRDPGAIRYAWYPYLERRDYGLAPAQVYWLADLAARPSGPGVLAQVEAVSLARPDPAVAPERRVGPAVPGDPSPALVWELTWRSGPPPAPRPEVRLDLVRVARLRVDLPRAGIPPGRGGRLAVRTDGPTTLVLAGLRPGQRAAVSAEDGTRLPHLDARADAAGRLALHLPAGAFRVALGANASPAGPVSGPPARGGR